MATAKTDKSSEADTEDKSGEGVTIPEEFQKSVSSFLSSCETPECLDYIADAVNKKRMDMQKSEQDEMDTDGMPD